MKKLLFKTNIPKIYMMIMLTISILLIGSYFSYALFTVNKEKKNAINLVTGNLTGTLKVDGTLENKLVVDANSTKVFTIELTNNNNRKARYNFYYVGSLSNEIEVGYQVANGMNTPPQEAGVNLEASGRAGSSHFYKIKVVNHGSSSVSIRLEYRVGLDYNDLTLPSNAHLFENFFEMNEPLLASNMIPVTYDESNKTWVKADMINNWYDYDEQKWANAVTVNENSRENYLSASSGTAISMDDINTMWVWIPRYSYTIKSEDGTAYYGKQGEYLDTTPTEALPGEIDVKFIPTSIKERGNAKYIGTAAENWYTPDGFTFGQEELSGIWYAKFETSNQEGQYTTNDSTLTPIIKPKVTSWRSIQLAKAETAAFNMTKSNNVYGLSNLEVDTHISKNSEWAVVAYLSQSKYGKLGNTNYTGIYKRIYNNNYNGFRTGCSSGSPNESGDTSCANEYDDLYSSPSGRGIDGGGASTTGNIYGVYDMNGGAWEYVMANYNHYSGSNTSNNSGYTGTLNIGGTFTGIPFPDAKYYDLYTTNQGTTACSNGPCIGHAIQEVNNWYQALVYLPWENEPFMIRGGYYLSQNNSGVFAAHYSYGAADSNQSFRLAMSRKIS